MVEKIVFDEEELEELKIAIKNFTEGKLPAKQLKLKLLTYRGRIVQDISHFLRFCVDRINNDDQTSTYQKPAIDNRITQNNIQLQQEIVERNELLKIVAERVKNFAENLKKDINDG